MGWWPLGKSKPVQPSEQINDGQPQLTFDGIPSKFTHDHPLQPAQGGQHQQEQQQMSTGEQFQAAIASITLEDFKFENLVRIPCFRNAGLTGFSTFFVFFPIMLIYHKNVSRATNWAVGGFFIGTILGWEQCQRVQKRSLENVRVAQEVYQKKQEAKFQQMMQERSGGNNKKE